jgi:hypothetical protein
MTAAFNEGINTVIAMLKSVAVPGLSIILLRWFQARIELFGFPVS